MPQGLWVQVPPGAPMKWPLRLSARTSGSHPGKRSSTLLGAAKPNWNKACGDSEESGEIPDEDGEVDLHRFLRLSGKLVLPRAADSSRLDRLRRKFRNGIYKRQQTFLKKLRKAV